VRAGTDSVIEWAKNFGPAWLVMIADIDVASIITGLQAGSSWGYSMVFIMIALTLPLFFIQDAAGRLGIASGMGLGEAIKRKYGGAVASAAAVPMAVSDFLEYVAEYSGIAIGLAILGLPILAGLAVAYVLHTLIVISRKYRQAEAVLIPLSFLLVGSILGSGYAFHINVHRLIVTGLSPFQPYGKPSYDYLLAASIGSVIMPWMLYFHSGADARREKDVSSLRGERFETLIGALVSEALMAVIVVVGSHIPSSGAFVGVSSLTQILSPLGRFASTVVGLGFIFAGFLALVVISLGSAWGVMEAMGRTSKGSFLTIYALESLPAVLIVAAISSYIELILDLMVVYTIVIIPSLIFLGKLVSDRRFMNGRHYRPHETALFWAMSLFVVIGGTLGIYALL
jgi:manganese transport protein